MRASRRKKAGGARAKKQAKSGASKAAKASRSAKKAPARKAARPARKPTAERRPAATVPAQAPERGRKSDEGTGGGSSPAPDRGAPPPLPTPIATFNF